jgi:hypothetical protein
MTGFSQSDQKLIEWLLENGGPAIRLQVAAELDGCIRAAEIERSVADLLEIEAVCHLLSYLDPFCAQDQRTIDKKTAHDLVHCYRETSLENFFPQLLGLGFRAGIQVFDEKVHCLRTAFPTISDAESLYGWVICEFCFKAGYAFPEMVAHMKWRLDALQRSAQEQIVDIYFNEDELTRLPKQWKDKRIIKHELNPYQSGKPLPTVHDIAAFAYFPRACLDAEIRHKIDTVVNYILMPAFQTLPEGYGFLWYPERRICLASGWSPTIPFFQGFERPRNYEDWHFLNYVDMLSRSAVVHPTNWFKASLDRLEQFRTEKGTYLFPEAYLHQKRIDQAFLSKTNLILKRSEKKALFYELISTIFVLKLKQRIGFIG